MKRKGQRSLLLIHLLVLLLQTHAEKILLVTHPSSPSHVHNLHRVATKLLRNNSTTTRHSVTILAWELSHLVEIDPPENIKEVIKLSGRFDPDLLDKFEAVWENFLWEPLGTFWDVLGLLKHTFMVLIDPCLELERNPQLWKRLRKGNYSVAIIDPTAHPCAHVILNSLGIPYLQYCPLKSHYEIDVTSGTPNPFAYNPALQTTPSMSFKERTLNIFFHLFMPVFVRAQLTLAHYSLSKQKYGDENPDLLEEENEGSLGFFHAENRAKLSLVLSNRFFDFNRPQTHTQLNVWMPQDVSGQSLPQSLLDFIEDESSEGTVIFSMTTLSSSASLPSHIREALLDTFKKFPKFRFVWRLEPAWNKAEKEANIWTSSWIPQSLLLGHPKTRVIITHAGINSVMESMYFGVPILAIPLFGDQYLNAAVIANRFVGITVNKANIDRYSLTESLQKILHEKSYSQNAAKISRMMQEERGSLGSGTEYWTSWSLRRSRKQLNLLKPKGRNQHFLVYFSIDTLSFTLLLFTCLVLAFTGCCVCVWRVLVGKNRLEKRGKRVRNK